MTTPFDDATTPPWLRDAVVEQFTSRVTPPPRWLALDQLPPLPLGGHVLNPRQVHAVLTAFKSHSEHGHAPLVALLKEKIDPLSRDTFVWELLRLCIAHDAVTHDRWTLDAVGLWGGDASAAKLAGLIRAWRGGRYHERARRGLGALRVIGSDAALSELARIAHDSRLGKLHLTARGMMLDVAAERRLTPEQLEDRIVPTLGLDAPGGRAFDLGPRRFHVVLNRDLKPMLRDDKGKLRADLPRSTDAAAKDALAEWKELKKQLRDVLKAQTARLESALVTQRAWPVDAFQACLVRHPVMGLLARRLLWGGRDADGRLVTTFRVTEDRAVARVDESSATLDAVASVALVHPLHLPQRDREAWQQAFADHELLPPFPQLARPVFPLRPEDTKQVVLLRRDGTRVEGITLLSLLDRLGWERGPTSADALGLVCCHVKAFPQGGLLAVLHYRPGVAPFGFSVDERPQALAGCTFVRRAHPLRLDDGVPLAQVDPVVVSEVAAVVEALAGKALD